jgi:hypothetical protein
MNLEEFGGDVRVLMTAGIGHRATAGRVRFGPSASMRLCANSRQP